MDKLQSLAFEPYEVELETARDLFLFTCYTGVAYCDMVALNREHLFTDNEGTFVYCRTQIYAQITDQKIAKDMERLMG